MKQSSPWFSEEQGDQQSDEHETEMDDTQKLGAIKSKRATSTISVENTAPTEYSDTTANPAEAASETPAMPELPASQNDVPAETDETPTGLVAHPKTAQKGVISRGRTLLLSVFLLVVIINAANVGTPQFIGAQGWAFVLGGSTSTGDPNLLKDVVNQLRHIPTPGIKTQATPQVITPAEYINVIVNKMTLDEKLGQMMIVQFYGPDYGLEISTMISQYKVGAALIFAVNNNIASKPQLKSLLHQMQVNSSIPMITAIDQEGGTVDRLLNLDGPRPSAASIGATNDPSKAMAEVST
jgi:beta-N-acetylhexosaminidase